MWQIFSLAHKRYLPPKSKKQLQTAVYSIRCTVYRSLLSLVMFQTTDTKQISNLGTK